MIEMERKMNEQKLKMLIKFEKIKLLEDFYNVSANALARLLNLNCSNTTRTDQSAWNWKLVRRSSTRLSIK